MKVVRKILQIVAENHDGVQISDILGAIQRQFDNQNVSLARITSLGPNKGEDTYVRVEDFVFPFT